MVREGREVHIVAGSVSFQDEHGFDAQHLGLGGFAAFTENRNVNLGGAGAGVTWGTGSFVSQTLILGAAAADATVTFQNPINLGGAVRTVQVEDGGSATDGKLTGALSSSAGGGLTKTGAGTLNLDSATQSYNILTASSGTTNVNGALGTLPGLAVVTVSPNAQLKFGTVSQTLASLSIGAGAKVTFTSGPASFADSGDGKAPGLTGDLTGSTAVPEPGTLGLLLVGSLGVLGRRRREIGK